MRFKTLLLSVIMGSAVAGLGVVSQAWAWGATGHRMIGEEGMRALPDYMPEFMRSDQAIADVGEFSREPDRWRGAGKVHDDMRDPAHFVDLDDDGNTLAGLAPDKLPATEDEFNDALHAKGATLFKSGYLPYSLVDGYEQVVKDMAFWRVLTYLETKDADKAHRAIYHADRVRREELTLRDIGVLSHYVGDTTQPLHLSVHYNGWGDYPNPHGFTTDRIHSPLEGVYVDLCFAARMKQSFDQVVPLYQLMKDGGFVAGDPRGPAFLAERIGQGAADLRDVILDAWRDSKSMDVGYKEGTYDDFVAGKIADPYAVLYEDGGTLPSFAPAPPKP
jgi:hypothetical protein